jgi:hypothetical protein
MCALSGCGGATTKLSSASERTSSAPAPGSTSGLGARVSAWLAAHPKHTGSFAGGCTEAGCYGSRVTIDGQPTYQYSMFSTTGGPRARVVGYEQAIGSGASLASAEAHVLALLPGDTRTTARWTVNERKRWDSLGGDSCVLWNLQSPTLARWLGGRGGADPGGTVGVILFTYDSDAEPVYRPGNVTNAIVSTAAAPRDAGC